MGQILRRLWRYMKAGWFSVTLFYGALLALSYAAYRYTQQLPGASAMQAAAGLRVGAAPATIWSGLSQVWFIMAWGFVIQLLVQINWILKRRPKDGDLIFLLKRGAWLSAHAGLFEELVFRYYAYLSFVMTLNALDHLANGGVAGVVVGYINPVMNTITLGYFAGQLSATNWALGAAIIIGAGFFRSAHIHYGRLSKANVWFIGLVMFWLTFNYGLVTAIVAHFLYDLAVFTAIALASPLQPHTAES